MRRSRIPAGAVGDGGAACARSSRLHRSKPAAGRRGVARGADRAGGRTRPRRTRRRRRLLRAWRMNGTVSKYLHRRGRRRGTGQQLRSAAWPPNVFSLRWLGLPPRMKRGSTRWRPLARCTFRIEATRRPAIGRRPSPRSFCFRRKPERTSIGLCHEASHSLAKIPRKRVRSTGILRYSTSARICRRYSRGSNDIHGFSGDVRLQERRGRFRRDELHRAIQHAFQEIRRMLAHDR